MASYNFGLPALNCGLGLRHVHIEEILQRKPPIRWLEIIADDFAPGGQRDMALLDRISALYPVIAHGVGMSIGSTDPLDFEYLGNIKLLADRINSRWLSDHLCFSMVDHVNINELVPLPFTEEALRHVVARIQKVQETLERPFLVENITRYFTVSSREMSEAEFISRVVEDSNCGLLLDITNVLINSKLHDFDALDFIRSLPLHRVGQIHLSGWQDNREGILVDSHDAPIPDEVRNLFLETIRLTGPTSVLVEWDREIPQLDMLMNEAEKINCAITQAVPKTE